MDSYSLGYANIALVKYWGKKSKDPVLPFNPNISLRLDNLLSKTKIEHSLTDEDEFYKELPKIRAFAGDRAVLRSIHFFDENKRVDNEIEALKNNDFASFLKNITDSGNSSWKYLQNVYTNAAPNEQGITVALALSERFLKEKNVGATRVHGGGFAGVIMAMVPENLSDEYVSYMDKFLGKGSSYKMKIRPYGSICLDEMI